jgi:hypothetical protein
MEFISKFKQYLNENFGNSPEERWEYIQPKLVNLPDTPDTQALIKGMEDAMMEDNKFEFDYYFVEAMKMLGLENELGDSEDDNPSSKSNFTDRELANIFVRENDKVLDEIIKEGTWSLGSPEEIEDVIQSLQGVFKMADNAEDVFQHQLKDEQLTGLLYKILGDDIFFDHYDAAKTAAEAEDFDRAKNYLGDAINRAKELKATTLKNNEVKGEVQTESIKKVLDASNDLETALNNASDELTDDQIDSITNMILDLRDKVKAELKK